MRRAMKTKVTTPSVARTCARRSAPAIRTSSCFALRVAAREAPDAVGDDADEWQVMGRHQDRHAVVIRQATQDEAELAAHLDIERARRFVEDHQLRAAKESDEQDEALLLTDAVGPGEPRQGVGVGCESA